MDAAVDPDAMLMPAYARGDPAAFETLYARHRGMPYRFLLRSVRDPHRTDEARQRLRAFRQAHSRWTLPPQLQAQLRQP